MTEAVDPGVADTSEQKEEKPESMGGTEGVEAAEDTEDTGEASQAGAEDLNDSEVQSDTEGEDAGMPNHRRSEGYIAGPDNRYHIYTSQYDEVVKAEDLADAEAVCEKLGIKLHTANFAAEYWDNVFEHFLAEYKAGRTPNPDILCNREIKFKVFLEYAEMLGAEKTLVQKSGYYSRAAAANAADRKLIKRCAVKAVQCALAGKGGVVGEDEERANKLRAIEFERIKGGKPFNIQTD